MIVINFEKIFLNTYISLFIIIFKLFTNTRNMLCLILFLKKYKKYDNKNFLKNKSFIIAIIIYHQFMINIYCKYIYINIWDDKKSNMYKIYSKTY